MNRSVPFYTYWGHIGNKWSSLSSGSSSRGFVDTSLYPEASSRLRDRHTKSQPSWKGFVRYVDKFSAYTRASLVKENVLATPSTYCSQISNLHPECIVWELLQPFGSNYQPLVEEASNEVNRQKTEPAEKGEDLWLVIFSINMCCFCIIRDCHCVHDEYNGASAELGIRSWARSAGFQLKQVDAVVCSLLVLLHELQWSLGDRWKEINEF